MASVQTTAGALDPGDLGRTLIHEHFRGRDEAATLQWPHLHDDEAEDQMALDAARSVIEHGVKTVADPAPMYLGRDAELFQRITRETGLQIVACTGIYSYDYLPHFFANRDADFMADCFVHDIEQGIQGTDLHAAFLKCAADEPGVTENVEKIHRAAARASVRTGAPIMAHSHPASNTGPRQIEIFEEEGVDLAKVQIAHTGDTDDLDYIQGLLDKGVYIGMDRFGLELFLPMENRNRTVIELLGRGYAEQMMLSQDYVVALDWYPDETVEQLLAAGMVKDWSMTLLFEQVIPALNEQGMTDEQLDTMLVSNPARWLSG
ncbi:MAG: phosphotriesterase-related protein [Thermoleophilaceae bacterium]|jgi:phosphotriesterase-related protein|nr:phosphotriesterase-related protein [Thermoleophilaceae bacterium]